MRSCVICGKGRRVGNNVSHANNRTKKVWQPNLQRVHVLLDGRPTRALVCTRCIHGGKVEKVPVRSWSTTPAQLR